MDRNEQLEKANNLISEKDFENAKPILQELLKNGENDLEIQKNLGLVNVNLNLMDEARENFENVIAQNPEDATSHYYLGIIYDAKNNLQKSKMAY